jgi:nitroreductase
MKKSADTSQQLHPLLQERWSPRAFDSSHRIVDEDLNAILEAGRWSPSANNFQPWRFIVGKRGSKNFDSITTSLKGFNQTWAPNSSAYIALCAVMKNDDGSDRTASLYDCGIASAFMTIEATHRGFAVHQVAGFEKALLKSTFNLDSVIEPIAILVLGKQASPDSLSDETLKTRETASRARKALPELILTRD